MDRFNQGKGKATSNLRTITDWGGGGEETSSFHSSGQIILFSIWARKSGICHVRLASIHDLPNKIPQFQPFHMGMCKHLVSVARQSHNLAALRKDHQPL